MVQLDSVPCGCCNGIVVPLWTDGVSEEAPHPRQLCLQTRMLQKMDIVVLCVAVSISMVPEIDCSSGMAS